MQPLLNFICSLYSVDRNALGQVGTMPPMRGGGLSAEEGRAWRAPERGGCQSVEST